MYVYACVYTRGGAKHLTFANQVSNCRCVNCMPVSWISRPSYLKIPWEGRLIQEPNNGYTGVNCYKDLSHLHWGDIKHSRASTTEDVRCGMLLQIYGGHILHFTPSSKIGGKFSQTNGSLVCFIKCLHLMYVRIYYNQCASWSSSLTSYCNITDHNYL